MILFLILATGFLSGCLEDKVAPESDVEPTVVAVSVSPATLTLPTGGSAVFTASLTGSGNTVVNWSIQEGSSGGSVSSKGLYTAPDFSGTFHVVATSVVDPEKIATATVVVSSLLDATFGLNGKVQTAFGGNDRVNALKLQSDGKILAAGFSLNGTKNNFALVRYNADGSLDTSFGLNGKVTTDLGSASEAQAMAIQTDGKIVLGGFVLTGIKSKFALVRYHRDGTLDTAFGVGGQVTTSVGSTSGSGGKMRALVIQSDGKIVAGGFSFLSQNDFTLSRYNTNGALDTTFGTGGVVRTDFGGSELNGLALQTDGKIVASGFAGGLTNPGLRDFALARYSVNGTLDMSFGTGGKVSVIENRAQESKSLLIQANGKILAGGYSANPSNNDFALARFNSDGSLDTTFDNDGKVTTTIGSGSEQVNSLHVLSDGKIVAVGYSSNGTDNDFALARYNANGTLDTAFDGDGKLTTAIGSGADEARGLLIQSDGKIVAGGFTLSSLRTDFALARYNTDGSLDSTFDVDGSLTTTIGDGNDEIKAIGVQSNGNVIAAGSAFGVAGNLNNDFALARYNSGGILDGRTSTAIGTKDDIAQALVIQSDDKIVVGGVAFMTSTNDFALVRYLADGTLDTTFDTDGKLTTAIGTGNDAINALALQGDGKIVAAGTAFIGVNNNFALARYTSAGVLDTTFDGDGKLSTAVGTGSSFGKAVQVQSDGKILVAGMASNGSDFDFALVRYNTNGSLDTTFDTDGMVMTPVGSGHDVANAMMIQSDGKILVVGGTITGTPAGVFSIVRYNTDGSLDSGFGLGGIVTAVIGDAGNNDSQALAVLAQSDGKIVVGGFVYSVENNRDFALARFLADGSLDPTFGTGGKEISPLGAGIDEVHGLLIQSVDGKIVAGGAVFNANNENSDFALTRYLP